MPHEEDEPRRRKENDIWDYFKEIDEMFDRIFESLEKGEFEGPFFYGLSWSIDENGKPVIREFGNVSPSFKGVRRSEAIKPFYDVMVDPSTNRVTVIVELPGADKEKIDVEATENSVHVSAEGMNRKYQVDIPLEVEVNPDTAKATFVNGILQLTFEPKTPISEKGKKIRVE